MELPAAFEKRMQDMLGAEYTAFRASYNEPHKRGIRLNTVKCTKEQLERALPFTLVQTPFSPLSFYAPTDTKMAALPLYHAGAFYSQEPSASSTVTLLAPEPGDKVLDLCAAPGGKSTQIAALTGDTGLLWSNEVVRNRAAILSSNLERMGVRNTVVSSVYPEMLAEKLGGYFDKVLVDAPCSGEGMFRRDPVAVQEWSPEHVETVVLLSHKKADSYIHIDVEFGEGEGKIPVDSIAKRAEAYKPKEKVTYKMIKEYIEAKYGFKVHTAYIAEVKRNLGLPMYDAPNAVEELKQPRKHPTPEKVEAIKDALRYFAVI